MNLNSNPRSRTRGQSRPRVHTPGVTGWPSRGAWSQPSGQSGPCSRATGRYAPGPRGRGAPPRTARCVPPSIDASLSLSLSLSFSLSLYYLSSLKHTSLTHTHSLSFYRRCGSHRRKWRAGASGGMSSLPLPLSPPPPRTPLAISLSLPLSKILPSFHRLSGSQRRKWQAGASGGTRGAPHSSGATLPPSSSALPSER